MLTILMACTLPEPVAARFEGRVRTRQLDPAKPLAAQADACDGLVISVEVRLDAQTIAALPQSVRAIATYSVGTDHVDLRALAARGIALLNTPDVLSVAVAEVAVFLTLGAARRATESIDLIRSRQWTGWTPSQLLGMELHGKTAGIFGMGRIGREIAVRLAAFGMNIHYHNRSRLDPAREKGATYHDSFDGLLGASDVLVMASPSSPDTIGILNHERLAHIRPGAIVVNIARGNLIDDDALLSALTDGRVRAAGLDVFNNEPRLDPRYFERPNVFMLPHIGSSTIEARIAMGDMLVDGLLALSDGQRPSNLVSL